MEEGFRVPGGKAPGDVRNGEHGSQLVVHQHDGDGGGVGPDGLQNLLRGDPAVLVRGEIRHLAPLPLQPFAALQHGAVLHRRGDDVVSNVPVLPHGGPEGPVVPLGAAGGEKQAVRRAVQKSGHGLPPALRPLFHLASKGVLGAGVSVLLRQDLIHGVRHGPGDGGGGGVVQIDHVAKTPFGDLLKRRDSSIISAPSHYKGKSHKAQGESEPL